MKIYLADTIQRVDLNYQSVNNNLESYFAISNKLKRERVLLKFFKQVKGKEIGKSKERRIDYL